MSVLPMFVQAGEPRAEPSAMTQVCSLCLVLKLSHKQENILLLEAETFLLSDFCTFH